MSELVKRIYEAERELVDAIDAAAKEGIVVEIIVRHISNGTQIPTLLCKQILRSRA